MKTIHIRGSRPVRNGNEYYMEPYERDAIFSDNEVRHCDLCTMCGFPAYPECTKTCNNGGLVEQGGLKT